jgi:hypothetical protein
MGEFSINAEQRLYVIPSGEGYTCLGFDVAERKRRAVLQWLGLPFRTMEVGTIEHYLAYILNMQEGAAHNLKTGKRCEVELTPELIPYLGNRVEVTTPDGQKSRFWVGKSMGWMPCHLEIKSRNSNGGGAVYFPAGSSVRLIAIR